MEIDINEKIFFNLNTIQFEGESMLYLTIKVSDLTADTNIKT